MRVGADLLTAERVFINVGGRASAPPIPGLDQVDYLTNSSMMEIDFLPRHLLIIGGSYIGLEFASFFAGVGSQVTVFEMLPQIAAGCDRDISNRLLQESKKQGISIKTSCKVSSISKGAVEYVESEGASARLEVGSRADFGEGLYVRAGKRVALLPAEIEGVLYTSE